MSASTTIAGTTSSTSTKNTEISEVFYDFLLCEIIHWIQSQPISLSSSSSSTTSFENEHERMILRCERNAAKMERMGYDVGYRLSERFASLRSPFFPLPMPNTNNTTSSPTTNTNTNASVQVLQLEAIKFICKDFWIAVFHKQMDKLQTNHKGMFVLKDLDFLWLRRLKKQVIRTNTTLQSTSAPPPPPPPPLPPSSLPSSSSVLSSTTTAATSTNVNPNETVMEDPSLFLDDPTRMMTMQLLAFPCGMIRGALANLGIGESYEEELDSMEQVQQEHVMDPENQEQEQDNDNTYTTKVASLYESKKKHSTAGYKVVVSCDFLADGKNLENCSFNIKILPKE